MKMLLPVDSKCEVNKLSIVTLNLYVMVKPKTTAEDCWVIKGLEMTT